MTDVVDLRGKPAYDIRRVADRAEVHVPEPLMVVSADSHALPPAGQYLEYLDPKYRERASTYLTNLKEWNEALGIIGYPFSADVLDLIDDRDAIRRGGELGFFDPDRRLRETAADGIVAELLHPQGAQGFVPFYDAFNTPCDGEWRAAGARAHNRFLTDFCSVAPHRLLGVYLTYPWPDADAAADQARAAKEAGAKAIFPAQQAGISGDACPPFFDPSWDPFWAACQDLDIVVHIHAGFGKAQGSIAQVASKAREAAEAVNAAPDEGTGPKDTPLSVIFESFPERKPLWQFMFGGVSTGSHG